MSTMVQKLLFFLFATSCFVPVSDAADTCSNASHEVPLQSKEATASTLSNTGNFKGSVRYETSNLLESAVTQVTTVGVPEGICPAACKASDVPVVLFKSVPKEFRIKYSDQKLCAELLKKTQAAPIVFKDRRFRSTNELSEWSGSLAQGRGEDGEALYQQCSGDCSPQYEYQIRVDGEELIVDAVVLCGHARDKGDNMYLLSSSYRWSCQPVEEGI